MEALLARLDAIHAEAPLDLVLITGDMTDAGRSTECAEFQLALAAHPALAARTLMLPGNHDIAIVDRANPARLELPGSPGKRLRQVRALVAMEALHGARVRVLDAAGAPGPTLSDWLAPHRAAIAAFADTGSLRGANLRQRVARHIEADPFDVGAFRDEDRVQRGEVERPGREIEAGIADTDAPVAARRLREQTVVQRAAPHLRGIAFKPDGRRPHRAKREGAQRPRMPIGGESQGGIGQRDGSHQPGARRMPGLELLRRRERAGGEGERLARTNGGTGRLRAPREGVPGRPVARPGPSGGTGQPCPHAATPARRCATPRPARSSAPRPS
jgi:hypothetical protein